MERKMSQVYKPVKDKLLELKRTTGLKNESEVIAYLYALYESRYDKMSHKEHQDALDQAIIMHRQETI
jgi:hypothetical protein